MILVWFGCWGVAKQRFGCFGILADFLVSGGFFRIFGFSGLVLISACSGWDFVALLFP